MTKSTSRRNFLKYSSQNLLKVGILSYFSIPIGITPLYAELLKNKKQLTLLNDRPINAETPPHLLDEAITSTARHFVRNNGIPPDFTDVNANNWVLKINGNVKISNINSLEDIKND